MKYTEGFKKNNKSFNLRGLLKKYGEKKIGLVIFIIGIIFGVLISKMFKGFYWSELDLLNINYFNLIGTMEIDYKILHSYVLWKDFKNFLLIWGLCFTRFGINFIILILFYYGVQVGFFIWVVFMGYGLKGFLLIIGYTFPQIIIYLPVFILSLFGGYWLCKNLYFNDLYRASPIKIVWKYIIFILILSVFLFLGALLETYVGSFILIKILSGF